MFESDLDQEKIGGRANRRRAFLGSAVAAIAGLALWQWRKPRILEAAVPQPTKGSHRHSLLQHGRTA